MELRTTLKPKIDAWSAGKKDNIRALLASLHTVLWEGSGWTQPSMADMVEPGKVGGEAQHGQGCFRLFVCGGGRARQPVTPGGASPSRCPRFLPQAGPA